MTTPTPRRPEAPRVDAGKASERREPQPGLGMGRPGLFGDLKQNLTNQWKVRDR